MQFIWLIIIGFVVGLIARAILPGDQKIGFVLTALLGIAGSFVANFAGQFLGLYAAGSNAGFVASVLGALVLLVLYGMLTKK
ncbi:MAG: GlsB/YeaQ/YmgE family stress response membrane protein [Rhodoferax sp.]